MGLELLVTTEDVISLFTTDRELLLSALRESAISDTTDEYSPNIYLNPLSEIELLRLRALPKYIVENLGNEDYEAIIQTARQSSKTMRGLISFLVKGECNIDELAEKHVSELGRLNMAYRQLSALNEAELKDALDRKNLQWGIEGICRVIIRANMMYNPATRKEFLSQVKEGMLDDAYEQKLIAPFIGDASAKTL